MQQFLLTTSAISSIYIYIKLTSKETSKSKQAFEAYSQKVRVILKHYHAYNVQFTNSVLIKSVNTQGQTISYCVVNAHFQNGIAVKRIRDLQEQSIKCIFHAKSRWIS